MIKGRGENAPVLIDGDGIIVSKFGGTSLADSNQMRKVLEIIKEDSARKYIVVSAPGKRHPKDQKITDLLYLCNKMAEQDLDFDEIYKVIHNRFIGIKDELGLDIDIEPALLDIKDRIANGATADFTASRGEYITAQLLAKALDYDFVDAAELIVFDRNGTCDLESTRIRMKERMEGIEHAVIPGFYGAILDGKIKTFSRGGSDVTGAIIALGMSAALYENWTDVSGFLMADPRIVDNPMQIEELTYKELRELSYMGAAVLHDEATFPVRLGKIMMNIRNTNDPKHPGTIILGDDQIKSVPGKITGIAGKKGFTILSIDKTMMAGEVGFVRKVLAIMEINNVSVEHIPTGIDSISLVMSDVELENKLNKIIEEIKLHCEPDAITATNNMALLAVVGRGMIKTKGISAKLFTALYKANVNVNMISQGAGELSIIIGLDTNDFDNAIRSIYEDFVTEK